MSSFDSTETTADTSFVSSEGSQATTITVIRCHLRRSPLDKEAVRVISAMVNMMEAIGKKLFTGSHILRESFRREIEELAVDIMRGVEMIRIHLKGRSRKCKKAVKHLATLHGETEEIRKRGVRDLQASLQALHEPTGVEYRLFCHIASFYDASVYAALIQLHRLEPEHNAYQLISLLRPINDSLDDCCSYCREADEVMMGLDNELAIAKNEFRSKFFSSDNLVPSPTAIQSPTEPSSPVTTHLPPTGLQGNAFADELRRFDNWKTAPSTPRVGSFIDLIEEQAAHAKAARKSSRASSTSSGSFSRFEEKVNHIRATSKTGLNTSFNAISAIEEEVIDDEGPLADKDQEVQTRDTMVRHRSFRPDEKQITGLEDVTNTTHTTDQKLKSSPGIPSSSGLSSPLIDDIRDIAASRNELAEAASYVIKPAREDGEDYAKPKPLRSWKMVRDGDTKPREAKHIPRIFNGSFSQVEDEMHLFKPMQMVPKQTISSSFTAAETPARFSFAVGDIEELALMKTQSNEERRQQLAPISVRDFASNPPSGESSALPSPAALLKRSEASVSRDIEWKEQIIGGMVVRSRRPSRPRAYTVDDSHGWLQSPTSPTSPQSEKFSPRLPKRQDTL